MNVDTEFFGDAGCFGCEISGELIDNDGVSRYSVKPGCLGDYHAESQASSS